MAKVARFGLFKKLPNLLKMSAAGVMATSIAAEANAATYIPTIGNIANNAPTPASSTLLGSQLLRDATTVAPSLASQMSVSYLDRHLEDQLQAARIENFARVSGLPDSIYGVSQYMSDDAKVSIGSYNVTYADYKALQRLIDTNVAALGMSTDAIPFMLALAAQESSFRGDARASDSRRGNSATGFNQVIRSSGLSLAQRYEKEFHAALRYNNIDTEQYDVEGIGALYDAVNGHVRRNGRIVGYTSKVGMNEEQKVVMGILGSLHMIEHARGYERRHGVAPSALAGYYGHFSGSTANPDRVSGRMSEAAIASNRGVGTTRRGVVNTMNGKLQRISNDILIENVETPRQMAGVSHRGMKQEQDLRVQLATLDRVTPEVVTVQHALTSKTNIHELADMDHSNIASSFNYMSSRITNAEVPTATIPTPLAADGASDWSRQNNGYDVRSMTVTSSFSRAGEAGNRVTVRVEHDKDGNPTYQPIRNENRSHVTGWSIAA